jgi:hypothetical protein
LLEGIKKYRKDKKGVNTFYHRGCIAYERRGKLKTNVCCFFPVHVISASGSVVVVSMNLIATSTVMQNDVSHCLVCRITDNDVKKRLMLSTVLVLPAFLVFVVYSNWNRGKQKRTTF